MQNRYVSKTPRIRRLQPLFQSVFLPKHISKEIPYHPKGLPHTATPRAYASKLLTQYELWPMAEYPWDEVLVASHPCNGRRYVLRDIALFSWGNLRSYVASLHSRSQHFLTGSAPYELFDEACLLLSVVPLEQKYAVLEYLSYTLRQILPHDIEFSERIVQGPIAYKHAWLALRVAQDRGFPWSTLQEVPEWALAFLTDTEGYYLWV